MIYIQVKNKHLSIPISKAQYSNLKITFCFLIFLLSNFNYSSISYECLNRVCTVSYRLPSFSITIWNWMLKKLRMIYLIPFLLHEKGWPIKSLKINYFSLKITQIINNFTSKHKNSQSIISKINDYVHTFSLKKVIFADIKHCFNQVFFFFIFCFQNMGRKKS